MTLKEAAVVLVLTAHLLVATSGTSREQAFCYPFIFSITCPEYTLIRILNISLGDDCDEYNICAGIATGDKQIPAGDVYVQQVKARCDGKNLCSGLEPSAEFHRGCGSKRFRSDYTKIIWDCVYQLTETPMPPTTGMTSARRTTGRPTPRHVTMETQPVNVSMVTTNTAAPVNPKQHTKDSNHDDKEQQAKKNDDEPKTNAAVMATGSKVAAVFMAVFLLGSLLIY